MGIALSWLMRPHLKDPQEPLEPADFFPSLNIAASTPRDQTPEEMIAVMKSVRPKES